MKHWNVNAQYDGSCDIVDVLLENRGFNTEAEKKEFLSPPTLSDYLKRFPPEFKEALKEARTLIREAISKEIPILIYGDYDADGVCATSIMFNVLTKELGYDRVFTFIPNRFKHGYGLSDTAIDDAIEICKENLNVSEIKDLLIITVDTGITATNEIEYIKSLGYKVVLTDHHQRPENIPQPDVLVWSDQIVGSVIAWILSKVLGSKNSDGLALAGIATVTDVQELVGINRAIVMEALHLLNTKPPLGIAILSSLAKRKDSPISTYDLGWVIGPRLNASGRLVDADESLQMLTIEDPLKVQEAAEVLEKINKERQQKTLEMYEIAAAFDSVEVPDVIVSSDENYHEGIIGLVASRLVQKHYRPAIVISIEGAHGKGSVRSISGIDIISILRNFEELFVNLGGHPMAAGFTIPVENIEILRNSLISYFAENISPDLFIPELKIDMEVPLKILSVYLLEDIKRLEPFGLGNPEPKFLTKNLTVVSVNTMGSQNQHINLKIYDGKNFMKALLFNGVDNEIISNLVAGDKVDIVYKPKINEFRGNVSVDLFIEDIRRSDIV